MPKKGDILFIKTYDFVGPIIQKFTHCDFNHVAIFIDENTVVEARPSGIKKTAWADYMARYKKHQVQYAVGEVKDITSDSIDKMINFVVSKIGKGYDFLQVTTIAIWMLMGWYTKYPLGDVKWAWSCSELVAEAIKQGSGLEVKQTKDPNVSPADIYRSEYIRLLYTSII